MALGRKSGHTTSSAPSINVVAHDRMADRREMNADLMSPSGMEMGTKKVPRIEPGKAYEVGPGRPTFIDDCHALPVSRIAGYRLVDGDAVLSEVSPGHHRVATGDPPRRDRRAQETVGPIRFCNDQQSRSLLVEAVDHPRPLRLALPRQVATPPQQGVDERSRPVAGGRVDDHPRRLVDNEKRIVLVDDLDRDVLAGDGSFFYRGYLHPHQLAGLGAVARLLAPAADRNMAEGDERRRLGPRKIGLLGNKEIEADIAVRLDGKLSCLAQS